MNNDYKTQLQQKELSALKNKYRVALKWATGCGKSKMTIDLINNALSSFSPSHAVKILFLVAERAHIKNWLEECSKWDLSTDRTNITIICYASLHKVEGKEFDIIVFDEAHHMFTEKRMNIIQSIKSTYVYLLSATLSSSKIDELTDIYGKFIISTVTLKEAIKNDILPDPKVYVIDMSLDNTVVNQEIKIGSGTNLPVIKWEDRTNYIHRNLPCIIKCTQYQKYVYMTNTMEYWKQRYELSHNEFQRNMWVNMGSQRKRFLGDLKTGAVKDFLKTLPRKRRYVCFCSSIAQATELSRENTISSRRSAKLNQMIIDAFNNKQLHNIFAIGMITEGMNLNDIQTGIIVQLDGKERLFIQKFGRSLRAEDPVSYIFYYKGTQDEVYLNNALENIDDKYIQHINIKQLNTTKL